MAKRLSKTLWYGTDVDATGQPLLPPATTNPGDLDGLHKGELFMHLAEDEVTLWGVSSNGKVVKITGKSDEINIDLSDYLKKEVWDSVWEIRQDTSGQKYIYGKLPVVTQYGVTMYADNGSLDIPSIYAGLPIDNITLVRDTNGVLMINPNLDLGGGGGASSWDELEGIPSWIGATKPTYEYSEIKNTPDLSKYVSSDDLSKYVTLGTEQPITGKKNFTTGGLFVNGKQIQYDATNGCWKLEGNLLVTGGVTMYADGTTSGGSSAYSTLGSLLNVDDSIDASASVDRVLFQAAGSSEWITKPLSEIGGSVSGDYLPLTGGTLTGGIIFPSNQYNQNGVFGLNLNNSDIIGVNSIYFQDPTHANNEGIQFIRSDGNYDVVRAYNGVLMFATNQSLGGAGTSYNTIWHSGNDGNGSGLDADLLDGMQPSALSVLSASKLTTARTIWGQSFDGTADITKGDLIIMPNDGFSSISLAKATDDVLWQISARYSSSDTGLRFYYYDKTTWNAYLNISTNGYIGINVRNPSYRLHVVGESLLSQSENGNLYYRIKGVNYELGFGLGSGGTNRGIYDWTNSSWMIYRDTSTNVLIPQGNVGIGTTVPSNKLHIVGSEYIEASSAYGLTIKRTSNTGGVFTQYIPNNQNRYSWAVGSDSAYRFGIYYKDTNSNIDTEMMYVDGSGNMLVNGGITMYSDERKKTILNYIELSLKQIANAPLIEHYYNSDQNKTTHVGSIAQYWAGINDWFCKKDEEGFYTMEIQNAALASAISIARHLERYESKTDKKIRQLKKRISQLEDELGLLKKGA